MDWKLKIATWSLLCIAALSFTSCGGSDNDDDTPVPDPGTAEYRIDVTFDTPIPQGLEFGIRFAGTLSDTKAAKLYENGAELPLNDNGSWGEAEVQPRNYSIKTEKGSSSLAAAIKLIRSDTNTPTGFTIAGYEDGKKLNEQYYDLTDRYRSVTVAYRIDKNGADGSGFYE